MSEKRKDLSSWPMDYQTKKEELVKEILFQNKFMKDSERSVTDENVNIYIKKEGEMEREWE